MAFGFGRGETREFHQIRFAEEEFDLLQQFAGRQFAFQLCQGLASGAFQPVESVHGAEIAAHHVRDLVEVEIVALVSDPSFVTDAL